MWRSIALLDFSKAGEGDFRARATTLTAISSILAASVDSVLSDDDQWAAVKGNLSMHMGKFHWAVSTNPTTGLTEARLTDRNIYTFADIETAGENSVLPALVTSIGQILPVDWASEGTLPTTRNSVIGYLYG